MIINKNGDIEIKGWAENVRNLGGLAFITLRFNEDRLDKEKQVRVVTIGQYDFSACKHRHVKQTSVDLEMSFINSYEDVMTVMENLMVRIAAVFGFLKLKNLKSSSLSKEDCTFSLKFSKFSSVTGRFSIIFALTVFSASIIFSKEIISFTYAFPQCNKS